MLIPLLRENIDSVQALINDNVTFTNKGVNQVRVNWRARNSYSQDETDSYSLKRKLTNQPPDSAKTTVQDNPIIIFILQIIISTKF